MPWNFVCELLTCNGIKATTKEIVAGGISNN